MRLSNILSSHQKILSECAIAERLRRNPAISLHPTLYNTPLIYGPPEQKSIMSQLYQEYLDAADQANLPLLLTAPTWRLDQQRVKEAKVPSSINSDAVSFLTNLRDNHPAQNPVLVGALTGPKNDCYRPDLAPNALEAEEFHQTQIDELSSTQADFLLAQTLPSVEEAIGVARAMASANKPYIISFCTGLDGKVLDGTPLPNAMAMVDEIAPPIGFFVNCTHPDFLLNAYPKQPLDRLIGIQANASSKDVTQLDGTSTTTEADPVSSWKDSMLQLHEQHEVKILGGCCGTSLPHLQALTQDTT